MQRCCGAILWLWNEGYVRHAYTNAQGPSLAGRRPQTKQQNRGRSHVSASSSPSLQASFISSVMQQPWPACRSAEGGLYAWSQSTPNSIMLEGVSCVSSAQRLFTCAEPRCYFASPSVFIMMALFCLFWGRWEADGDEHAIAWSAVIFYNL